jgi:hypothetical protein
LEDLGAGGKVILKWIFRKWDGEAWAGLLWQVVGACECGNEPSGSIKCGEFLDYLRTCLLLNMDSAPRSYVVGNGIHAKSADLLKMLILEMSVLIWLETKFSVTCFVCHDL